MAPRNTHIYFGIGSHAVAVDRSTGEEVWRTKLKSSSFVTVWMSGDKLFAGAAGELFCLDPVGGEILWNNKLKGLGTGLISFASSIDSAAAAMIVQAQQAAAIAASA